MTTDARFTRRGFLQGGAALGVGAGLGLAGPALWPRTAHAAVDMAFGVGIHTMGGPLVLKMQKEGMIEAAAAELGIDVKPDYQDFQALLRMLQGVAAGQLHYGMLGSTPNIRLLASPEPAVPIALAGGGLDFPIQVPVGSDIRNMEDLRGKTILTLVGSDLHLTLNNMLKAHFGTDDVKELGITVKNMTAITELFEVQPGVDAYLGFEPGSFGAQQRGVMTTLIRNDGTTGQHYDGPEGKGAGLELEWFKNAPYYPEGFYPHRIWWVIREDFLAENPDAVTAFLVAHHRAAVGAQRGEPRRHRGPGRRPLGRLRRRQAPRRRQDPLAQSRLGLDHRRRCRVAGRPVADQLHLRGAGLRRSPEGDHRQGRRRGAPGLRDCRWGSGGGRLRRSERRRCTRSSLMGDRQVEHLS